MSLIFTSYPEFIDIRKTWNDHLDAILRKSNPLPEFELKRFMTDKVSKDLATRLLESLDSRVMFDKRDCNKDYVASAMELSEQFKWKKQLSFFPLEKCQLEIIKDICEEIWPTLEKHIGAHLKLINTKVWETSVEAAAFGPNRKHTDSMYPNYTHKVFVYLTGASPEIGTTKFYFAKFRNGQFLEKKEKTLKFIEDCFCVSGGPGAYAFFNPVLVPHCGVPPKKGSHPRIILELIMTPSHETEINPTYNGTNSTHPISPDA